MAIVENRASEIGDVIHIEADVPIIGLLTLLDYTDDLEGETASRFFKKTFRYSIDGVNWSDWTELTKIHIEQVDVSPSDTFFLEYNYERVGTNSGGELSFNSVTLDANYTNVECGPQYNKSIFKQLFNCFDIEVIRWCVNVSEKLYRKGIIPKYLTRGGRGNVQSTEDDRDYIDFWRSIACFFAIIVKYARTFERYGSNEILLPKYLEQWGIYFCNNTSLSELMYLKETYYDQINQRGTLEIMLPKDADKEVDGELLRLICHDPSCGDFVYSIESFRTGIVVDSVSPLYKGMVNLTQANKFYERTEFVEDLSLYPLFNDSYVSIVNDGTRDVMRIDEVPAGEKAGVGPDFNDIAGGTDLTKAIGVDTDLDYEFRFCLKQESLNSVISVGLIGLDKDNNVIEHWKIDTSSVSPESYFFEEEALNVSDQYYLFRGIIYQKNRNPSSEIPAALSLGYGNHLRFGYDVCKVIPVVIVDNTNGGAPSGYVDLFDFKLRPAGTDYSRGFVETPNFVEFWIRNNNGSLSDSKLEEILKRYLLPYNSRYKINYILERNGSGVVGSPGPGLPSS